MCDTGFGGYVNLENFGILTQAGITGDTKAWTGFSTGNPFNYYGNEYAGMSFTDDGFAIFDVDNNYAGEPWTPQMVPDNAPPNNVLPVLWQDFEIFYDEAANAGISLATAGANLVIVEYDDVQFFGGSADTFDFEIVMTRAADDSPGAYEIVYAYDNLNGDLSGPFTIGVENASASDGVALVNNDSAEGVISNGFMVCFDLVVPTADPVEITFQATVDVDVVVGSEITNTAVSTTSTPGSMEADTSASFMVIEKPLIGTVTQTPSADPLVYGDYVEVDVSLLNETTEDIDDGSAIVWLDDEVTYVDGSAYNATPLTAMQAADLLARMGQASTDAVDDSHGGDEVVGILWEGMIVDGESAMFGFTGMVSSTTGSIMHAVNVFEGYMPIGTFVSDSLEITETAMVEVPLLADTWLNGGDTATNFNDYAALVARTSGLDNVLLTFDRSALPEGANMISADLMVNVTLETGSFGKELTVLNTEAFDTTTVTYDTAPAIYNPGVSVPVTVGMMTFDVAGNVEAWDANAMLARVRVAHASPDAPAVDVLVNDVVALSNIAFKEITDYAALPAGTYNVKVVPTGATEPVVIEADLDLAAGTDYTVAAVNELASIEPLVLVDNNSKPAEGNAHVRFVHASPDAPAVDIAVTDGPVLFPNVAFKEGTDYLPVPAGTYDLEVRLAGTDTVVLPLPGITLEEGTVYTAWAMGLAAGSGEQALTAVISVERDRRRPHCDVGYLWLRPLGTCLHGQYGIL